MVRAKKSPASRRRTAKAAPARALTLAEIARHAALPQAAVWKWLDSSALPSFDREGRKYVLKGAYKRFLENQSAAQGTPHASREDC